MIEASSWRVGRLDTFALDGPERCSGLLVNRYSTDGWRPPWTMGSKSSNSAVKSIGHQEERSNHSPGPLLDVCRPDQARCDHRVTRHGTMRRLLESQDTVRTSNIPAA
jgi:hypothetical protein